MTTAWYATRSFVDDTWRTELSDAKMPLIVGRAQSGRARLLAGNAGRRA